MNCYTSRALGTPHSAAKAPILRGGVPAGRAIAACVGLLLLLSSAAAENPQAAVAKKRLRDLPPPSADPLHPLVHQWQKDGYNFWIELKTSLEQKAYADAAQWIFHAPQEVGSGLLVDLKDPQLLLPYPRLLAATLGDAPEVRTALRQQFFPLAELRLKTAIEEGDLQALESLRAQFAGTPVASAALGWLGDRALAGGRFEEALQHYAEAIGESDPIERPALEARRRLAGAMLGRLEGQAVTQGVQIGKANLEAGVLERLIAEMARGRQSKAEARAAGGLDYADCLPAPRSGPLALEPWPRPDEDKARQSERDREWSGVDGGASGLSLVAQDKVLIAADGRRLAAFDATSGRRRWSRDFGEQRAYQTTWKGVPLRPLLDGGRVYARRYTSQGIALEAAQLADGSTAWISPAAHQVVADPWLADGRLLAVTATVEEPPVRRPGRSPPPAAWRFRSKHSVPWVLSLARFDPGNGALIEQRPLVRLQSRERTIPLCRAVRQGPTLLLAFVGGVVAANMDGDVLWARRQNWQDTQSQAALPVLPVAGKGLALVTHSGADGVQAVDMETGRMRWQCPAPGVTRLVGIAAGRLIAQDGAGLLAIELRDGGLAWRLALEDAAQGFLCGGPGGLAYCAWRREISGRWLPALVWVDPATGKVAAQTQAEGLRPLRSPAKGCWFGPLVSLEGRLLAFYRDPGSGARGLFQVRTEEAGG